MQIHGLTILSILLQVLAVPYESQLPLLGSHNSPKYHISAQEWASLNKSVHGRLHHARPMGFPCYNRYEGDTKPLDVDACEIADHWKRDDHFLASQFAGYYNGNWGACQTRDEACAIPLNSTRITSDDTCYQGSVPQYYIEVRTVEDVKAGMAFFSRHSIPVVIKNSGHDASGRSSGPVPLALWTHHYTQPIELSHTFQAERCDEVPKTVVTFGAGQKFGGIHRFAEENDIIVIGGICDSVGAAGWIVGGGHTPLSPVYGLGVDNVQQYRVVLPNGTYVTVNRCQNPDLFFAINGGGGASFGTIMEITTLAHPKLDHLLDFSFSVGNLNASELHRFLEVLVSQATDLARWGWGGYLHPKRPGCSVTIVNSLVDAETAKKQLKPLIDFAESINVKSLLQTRPSWWDFYDDDYNDPSKWNGSWSQASSSRLIPIKNFDVAEARANLVETLADIMADPVDPVFMLTTPFGVSGDGFSSIHPSWRKAVWLVTLSTRWDQYHEHSQDVVLGKFHSVHDSISKLRKATPGSGAWLNEADIWEPDEKEAFWGRENYEKLLSIKRKYDPENMMQIYQGIGWDPSHKMYTCYPQKS